MTDTPMTPQFLYVYCIVEGMVDDKFGKMGIGGRGDEVYGRPYKDLTAIVSRSDERVFERNEENVLAHQRVIEKIFSRFPALPLPFSTILDSETELEKFLGDHYDEFRDKLEKLRELVQPVTPEPAEQVVEEALAHSFSNVLRIRQLSDEVTKLRTTPTVDTDQANVQRLASEVSSLKEELQALRSLRESLVNIIEKVNVKTPAEPEASPAKSLAKLREELDGIKKIQTEARGVTESAEQMMKEIMGKLGISERHDKGDARYG